MIGSYVYDAGTEIMIGTMSRQNQVLCSFIMYCLCVVVLDCIVSLILVSAQFLMKTLGLDLSTSTCGFAILEDRTILHAGFFDISKSLTYKDKSQIIIDGLKSKQFDRIVVEESLLGFRRGNTSQQIIVQLIKNKAVICYILEQYFKVPVISANVNSMRKQLFGKARVKNMKSKEYVKQEIEKMFDIQRFVKYNRKNVPDKRMEDVYDAIVCGCFEG